MCTTMADIWTKATLQDILDKGIMDINPRPHWEDGTPAHTLSINHVVHQYDLAAQWSPFLTLRPTAYKSGIGEILWIYRDASNNLDMLKDKYGITWWDEWDIGDRTIGACYGETVRRYNLLENLFRGIISDEDGRRHIMNMWQEQDFKEPHGLKPCCYQTVWNIRHVEGKKFVDVSLFQRSSDFTVSGNINTLQYIALMYMVIAHLNYIRDKEIFFPGVFTHFYNNCQIYDRHIEQAKELISRDPYTYMSLDTLPHFEVEPQSIWNITVDDVKVVNYNKKEIAKKNPQLKFEVAI